MATPEVAHGLSRAAALERVTSFAQNFGEQYLDFACHAAFPLILTPELLYNIWANFSPETPWIAVADLLLSNLCNEIGFELYEMDVTVRDILLTEMVEDPRFGSQRIHKLAQFLKAFAARQATNSDPDVQDVAQTYQWIADSYLQPSNVAKELATALTNPDDQAGTSILRLTLLTEALSKQLKEHDSLLKFSSGMKEFIHGNIDSALQKFRNANLQGNYLDVANSRFQIPDQIKTHIQIPASVEALDQLILDEYPYPIAANYRRILLAKGSESRLRECITVFDFSIRFITMCVLSQYLIRDRDVFSDPTLNRELYKQKLSNISTGMWVNYLFLALKAYRGRRELFFIQEIYDLYWDTSRTPHQPRKGVQGPFQRLVEIRNLINHMRAPHDEAGWEKLGREALGNLRELMMRFSFLQNYDLLRIVKPVREEFECERYTGQKITYHQEEFKSEQNIQPGWFYLSRQDHSLLGLHPLLILWTNRDAENWIEGKQSEEHDVGVLDELMKDVAGYIATVVREVFTKNDETLIAQLRDLVEKARQQVRLSWEALQESTQKVSSEEMESAQKKYNPALYLQREAIFIKFKNFLASEQTCFVLTGKSGAGKSNFVLSLAEVLASEKNVAVMMYNAARLDVSSMGMVQKISQDLGKFVKLDDKTTQDVLAQIDKSKVMTDRQLLVIFDAVNESTNPREILYKIDQLVGKERYPWLKILITSRPESWRTMKRGLALAEHRYYKEQGSVEFSSELEEFTVRLEIFDQDELELVYEKYRNVFGLRTDYSTLEPTVRNVLRDPLVLRLVAGIYRDKFVPDNIQASDIYRFYINYLLTSGHLYQIDVDFLEQELMQLMLRPGFYENQLTASEIQPALTRDGRPIREMILDADPIGVGQRVNDSYVRLRDTEILDHSGSGMDYVIHFKNAAFFDFFGGRRLYRVAKEYTPPLDLYHDTAKALATSHFLWGALVNALILELKDRNLFILKELAETSKDNQYLRDALVETLVRFGYEDLPWTEKFLMELIGPPQPPRRLFFRNRPQDNAAKDIASEAASRLGLKQLL